MVRSGGRDNKGNALPDVEIPVPDCLIAARATTDPIDRSDAVDAETVVYHNTFLFLPTDKIRIPAGARMAGLWKVKGRTKEWPLGNEVGVELA